VTNSNLISCDLGIINPASPVSVELLVIPPFSELLTNNASVMSNRSDPAAANNSALLMTTINAYGIFAPVIRK